MQDILITPGSGEPQILFRGSGVNDTAVELNVLSSYQSATGSGTALLFEGEQGQLFAITDNLSSGVIFSVADITGLPAIEYNASGELKLGEYASNATFFKSIDFTGGTVTTSSPLIDGTQTWNDGAVAFTALKLNVTDTASSSSSLLMDLQNNSATKFKVWKDGSIQNAGGALALSNVFSVNWVTGPEVRLTPSCQLVWATTNATSGGNALILTRESDNVLGQHNGTNPQSSRIFNTRTSDTNLEALQIKANTTQYEISSIVGSAGGTNRALAFGHRDSAGTFTNALNIATNGFVSIGTNSSTEDLRIHNPGTSNGPTYFKITNGNGTRFSVTNWGIGIGTDATWQYTITLPTNGTVYASSYISLSAGSAYLSVSTNSGGRNKIVGDRFFVCPTGGSDVNGNTLFTNTFAIFSESESMWNIADPGCRLLINTKSTSRKGIVFNHPSATSTELLDLQVANTTVASISGSGGMTLGDKAILAASTVSAATLNIPSGTAPTAPNDGDIWSDGSDLKIHLSGVTYTLQKA